MLEALLTLMVLASGPAGHDNINASNSNYGLELAFEQASVDASLYEDAVALQMAQANERVAEAQASHGNGDAASAAASLNAYDQVLGNLAYAIVAADAIDDDALLVQLDADLAAQDAAIAEMTPDQQEGTAEPEQEEAEGEGNLCTNAEHPVGAKIAEKLGLTYEQVIGLLCANGEKQYGLGQVMMAAKIAEEAGIPLDQVLALRAEGKGWGQIKKDLGVTQPGGKHGKKCTDRNPKDGINDETGEACPPKGNGGGNGDAGEEDGGNGNGNGNGGGNGKNCPDKNPKDGINDDTGETCPPKDADDDDDEQEDGGAEPTSEPTTEPVVEATAEPTQQP